MPPMSSPAFRKFAGWLSAQFLLNRRPQLWRRSAFASVALFALALVPLLAFVLALLAFPFVVRYTSIIVALDRYFPREKPKL